MAEKEYIERGALLERLEIVSVVADDLYGMGINTGLDRADKEVRELPAADVVEVVRCKDCVHYNQNQYSTDEYMMCKHWCDWLPTDPDDFCSYGERKEQK